MQAIKNFFAAFFTDAQAVALKNADKNGDGKIDMKDVQAEYAKVKADLQAKQASYWNIIGIAGGAAAIGAYFGKHFL